MEDNKIDQAMNTAGSLISQGKAIQQIQTPYVTAVSVQKPRNLKDILVRCLEEAELAGDDFYYSWPTTKKEKQPDGSYLIRHTRVEDVSIWGAESMARNFENCAVVYRPLQETQTAFVFTAVFIDQERGYTLERPFRMDKKWIIDGKMNESRKMDIRFAIGASKAARNVICHVMPIGIRKKVVAAAKQSVRVSIDARVAKLAKGYRPKTGGPITEEMTAKAFKQVRKEMIDEFVKIDSRLTSDFVATYIDLAVEHWDTETLATLAGDLKALKDGTHTASELFEAVKGAPSEQAPANKIDPDDMSAGDPETHQDYTDPNELRVTIANTVTLHNIDQEIFTEWLKQEHEIDSVNDIPDSRLQQVLTALKAAAIDLSKIEAGGELPLGDKKSKGNF